MNPVRSSRFAALAFACAATFAGGAAQAVTFPSVPLESGVLYPPPNVMFILDDSGSMNLVSMPGEYADPLDTSTNGKSRDIDLTRVSDASYVNNTIYFNPATTYLPWMTASGTRLGNASYTAASRHTALLTSPENLANSYQTWFIPHVAGFTGGTNADYTRYQIVPDSSSNAGARRRVVSSEWITLGGGPAGFPVNNLRNTSGVAGITNVQTIVVPAGIASMTVTLSGGNHGTNGGNNNGGGNGADLYVDNDADVGTGWDCRSLNADNVESCTINNPGAGNWFAGISRASNYTGVTMAVTFVYAAQAGVSDTGCSTATTGAAWRNCTLANTAAQDAVIRQNYANWFHYHRSRMKVAKAGASEAFSSLDLNLRIGYDSINRGGNAPLLIPVGNDDGLFRGDNKDDWYDVLQAETADGTTYLHRALQRSGVYFSDDDSAESPYRSSSDDEVLACRQNFAILTTDGYWNSTAGYTPVGDADGTDGPDTHSGPDATDYTYDVQRPYQDNLGIAANRRTNTLADVAMHYWKTDLAPDLENSVPDSNDDPAFWQHMVTFGVSIGLAGTLNPATDVALIEAGSKEWPDTRADSPGTTNATRIDDLLHASVNGRGDFVVASNTQQFADALTNAFELLDSRTGAGSNVSTNSTSTQTDRFVYQASYDTGRWSGTLEAFAVDEEGVAEEPTWTASTPAYGSRHIFTWNTASPGGAAFPTAAQVTALDRSARAEGPVSGADNAAYLAGDRSREATGLRKRDGTIGDITNSSPFYDAHSDTIYVGANDGMLHAFDARTGVESMAYVPRGISLANLADLSSPTYEHHYFVDGPIVVTSFTQTPNRNILIGGLGRGGRGLYALDVTDVDNFDASDVLWDISDADLGNVLGEPLITKLQDGTVVAIVGNGLNSNSQEGVLFVINVTTGAFEKIRTGQGDAANPSGLFAPRGWDDDNDGLVDRVFANDYLGNVWKFDFSSDEPELALGGDPLFTTPDQRLSSGLALAKNVQTGELFVYFGTGAYFTTDDSQDESVQSLYAIIDRDESVTLDDLQPRDILQVDVVGTFPVRAFEEADTLDAAKSGWYIDLDEPTPGERVITRPFVVQDTLFFATRVPPFDQSDRCSPGGTGYINALDAFNGTSFDVSRLTGITHDGRTVPGLVGGMPVGSVDIGINMPTQPTIVNGILVVGGSAGELGWIALPNIPGGSNDQRATWRELEGN